MTFYDIDPLAFPKGAQFFFNIVISTIAISYNSDILPKELYDYWYLGGIKESQPFAIYIYRSQDKIDNNCNPDIYTHCVLEIDPDQSICWYDMVEYETEDPWDPTPILEDFDDDDEDESDNDY